MLWLALHRQWQWHWVLVRPQAATSVECLTGKLGPRPCLSMAREAITLMGMK